MRIHDEPHPETEAPTKQSGLGLGIIGMRERMSAMGGSLEAGPKSRGGWLVRAHIPHPWSLADPDADVAEHPAASSITDSTAKAEP